MAASIYKFDDGEFQFFTALFIEFDKTARTIFRVRLDNYPEGRALEKQIPYNYIRPSSFSEVELWLHTHDLYPLIYSW